MPVAVGQRMSLPIRIEDNPAVLDHPVVEQRAVIRLRRGTGAALNRGKLGLGGSVLGRTQRAGRADAADGGILDVDRRFRPDGKLDFVLGGSTFAAGQGAADRDLALRKIQRQ